MRNLLDYILKGILGDEKFDIVEDDKDGKTTFKIKSEPKNIGLIIGRNGRMIKNIRNILKTRATLEKKAVSIEVEEN